MKKNKLLLIPVILSSLLCLSACSEVTSFFSDLLNEDALSFSNQYNPPANSHVIDPNAVVAQGVESVEIEEAPTSYCFKNICYAPEKTVLNTYKKGKDGAANGVNFVEYDVNGGEDYSYEYKSNTVYDLYVPKALDKTANNTVILFIHGGAWIMGFKSDVNEYVHEFANRGYITATIKYTLLKKTMDDPSLSIFRNLDEIDACIKSIKAALVELGFDASKLGLVIGGASSGAHLAMLYSYSRGQRCPLPIKFVVDAVGPVDIKPDNWKRLSGYSEEEYYAALDEGISYEKIETQRSGGHLANLTVADPKSEDRYEWDDYNTMRIANGMCGLPFSLADVEATTDENKQNIVSPNAASESLTKAGGGEDQVSVTYWINKGINKFKIVTAYAGLDGVVGIAQYAALEKALNDNGITHSRLFYFKSSGHTQISANYSETEYNGFVSQIDDWCKA